MLSSKPSFKCSSYSDYFDNINFYSIIYPIIHSRPDFFPVFFQISVAPSGLQSDAISEQKMKLIKIQQSLRGLYSQKLVKDPIQKWQQFFTFIFFFIVNNRIMETTENNTNSIYSDVWEYSSLLSVIAWTSY